jgi:hypothetical protein
MIAATTGISVSLRLVHVLRNAQGHSRKKRVLVHTRLSAAEIPTRGFIERRDL